MTLLRLPRTARRNQIAQVMNNLAIAGLGDIPVLDLNFVGSANPLPASVTFTRASGGTRINSLGSIELLTSNVPRFDYDPVTLAAKGLLIEEQRTNSIRNSEAGGASVGTPGTLPTNWTQSALASGLTRQIVSIGTLNGLNYLDIRISGTTADTSGWQLEFETSTQIAAATGQNWNNSFYCYLLSGSISGVTSFNAHIIEGNPGYLADTLSPFTPTSTTALLSARRNCQRLTNNALTSSVRPGVFVNIGNGQTVDFTLRIAAPQMEGTTCTFPTSYIPTISVAVTRAADIASMTGANFSSWFNAVEGTFVVGADISGNNTASSGFIASGASARFLYKGNGTLPIKSYDGTTVLASTGNISYGTSFKAAISYTAGSRRAISFNGAVADITATCAAPYTAGSLLYIGTYDGGSSIMTGHIQRITYYNKSLSDATLQALST